MAQPSSPWRALPPREDGRIFIEDADGLLVAIVPHRVGKPQREVAALIAAAPLLEAALVDVYTNASADSPEMWARVEAALNASKGLA